MRAQTWSLVLKRAAPGRRHSVTGSPERARSPARKILAALDAADAWRAVRADLALALTQDGPRSRRAEWRRSSSRALGG